MSDFEEIKALLREIRDLQKAHFERYKEFTQDIIARRKTDKEELEQSQLEARKFRNELRARHKSGLILRLVILGIAVVAAVILAVGAPLLVYLLSIRRF